LEGSCADGERLTRQRLVDARRCCFLSVHGESFPSSCPSVRTSQKAGRVTLGQTPQVLALVGPLRARLRLPNLAAAIRQFAAQPAKAFA
jgi:hypothetical protein